MTDLNEQHVIRRINACSTLPQLHPYWTQVLGVSYQRRPAIIAAKDARKAQLEGVRA